MTVRRKMALPKSESDYKNLEAVLDAAQKVRFESDIRFIIRRLTEWVDYPIKKEAA